MAWSSRDRAMARRTSFRQPSLAACFEDRRKSGRYLLKKVLGKCTESDLGIGRQELLERHKAGHRPVYIPGELKPEASLKVSTMPAANTLTRSRILKTQKCTRRHELKAKRGFPRLYGKVRRPTARAGPLPVNRRQYPRVRSTAPVFGSSAEDRWGA